MALWSPFISASGLRFDASTLIPAWNRLHRCDAEPLPASTEVLQAWVHFHNGDFQSAAETGLRAGDDGVTVANKATSVYARYLETRAQTKLDLFLEVAARAQAQQARQANNPNAYFWQAYALGHYGQCISIAKGLADGVGHKVKAALERTIAMCPTHADAHLALACFHAEAIDKVGLLIGGMTYGAKKEVGLALFRQAMALNPDSPLSLMDCADGLVMLEGEDRIAEATALYERAASCAVLDALDELGVIAAKLELQD